MEERPAEAVHVGAVVNLFKLDLLGRNVVGRAPYFFRVLLHTREAEVDELRVAVGVQKNVFGLHVAVHITLIACALQRLRHLLANLHHARDIRLAGAGVLHQRIERTARDELHRDIRHAVAKAIRIYLGDVGMDEFGGSLGLFLELLDELRVRAVFLEHHLDGDRPVKHFVAPHVDAAHSAGTELTLKQKIAVFPEYPGSRYQLFAHLIVLHPLNGQKTKLPTPRRFSLGTGPQYLLSFELAKLSPHAKYSPAPMVTSPGRPATGCSRT